ncbi:6cde8111-6086-43bd-a1e8-ee239a9198e9 [Thermothielavioides terrestris]|uniref:6cde8111-6086-43bd-a1e8-ee239a9198e9 n=1 Tax=Thermothielavioides terrestris TaxID=2587410 RepID=A0A446BAU9_9PEZI|nr:6cde8111-6086-43bd-a1e8-ee239a9198e9 [Thermothielavioides terrestris]
MMSAGIHEPPYSIHLARNAPYNLPLAALASSSSSSLWSDVASQHSDDSVSTAATSDSDSSDSHYFSRAPTSSQTSVSSLGSSCESAIHPHGTCVKHQAQAHAQVELPAELRQNPRRTGTSATSRTGRPPSLVRQADRKVSFVENLVETSTHIVEAIWPTSSVPSRHDGGGKAVLPLRKFIEETLRRSRTSYSTLQVALYYLILIKPHVPVAYDFTTEQPNDCPSSQAIQCGRRMFLAALILASKYLQDRNYSARAWSKISGLNTLEINQNELVFLLAVNWKLHLTEEIYKRWADCVSNLTPTQPPSPGGAAQQLYEQQCYEFRRIILNLTPDLDNLEDLAPWSPTRTHTQELPPRSLYTPPAERAGAFASDVELATPFKPHGLPAVMEPVPSMTHASGRLAPALGLLPTPRLTPQTSGFSTPAAVHGSLAALGRIVSSELRHSSFLACQLGLHRVFPRIDDIGFFPGFALLLDLFCFLG